jgi:RNA polymerase sigma factor, sigma-70 family
MVSETEFLKIIDINKGSIYTICYMFSKDREDVNDLYQDVILNLWKGYETFKGESKISTWIYKVSLNTCLLVNRKKRKFHSLYHYRRV